MIEQKIMENYFGLIAQDGAYCYSSSTTITALEQGLVETLIVWDELPDFRFELVSLSDPNIKKVVFKPTEKNDFPGYEVINSSHLLDWILENHKNFGSTIELVSSACSIANQFIKGFGGIGGILRFKSNPQELEEEKEGELSSSEESEYDYEY